MTTLIFLLALQIHPKQIVVIPTPEQVIEQKGEFTLGRHFELVCAKPSLADDSFAAEQLIAESPNSFGWGRSKKKGHSSGSVLIGQIGRDGSINVALKSLRLSEAKLNSPDGYILSVRPQRIICAGKSSAGTFYAIQTLKQLIRTNLKRGSIPCIDIIDQPKLEMRGWQDDISRGPIPTMDFLKQEVRELSEYKLNTLTLYTEHVFKLKKHPTIAPNDGISAEQIQELDRYCKKYHVQLIANFQSFGHFANILSVPGYENLKETGDIITPAKEESYQFLSDVYGEIAPAYSSKFFNINCDETYGLGEGPAKEMVQKEGLGQVYAKHINRIASLLKTYNKTPMMWGDIALQYPDIRKNLPKNLIVLTWGYDPRASFINQIEPFTKIGFKFLVCPGVSCWGQTFPNIKDATTNISNFVRDGALSETMGVMNTTWDDTGENLFQNNWYPLVWGAEVSWAPPSSGQNPEEELANRISQFNSAFPQLFFGLPDGTLSKAFWDLSNLRSEPGFKGLSDRAFWVNPWIDTSNSEVSESGVKTLSRLLKTLKSQQLLATRNSKSLDAALFAAKKLDIQLKLFSAQQSMSRLKPSELSSEKSNMEVFKRELESQMADLKSIYISAWKNENRPWWLDRNLARFDQMQTSISKMMEVPFVNKRPAMYKEPISINLATFAEGSEIRYTTDDSEPLPNSPSVKGAIQISSSQQLRARVFKNGVALGPELTGLYLFPTRPCQILTPWKPYDQFEPMRAFDGRLDTFFWSYGSVWAGSTFDIIFDDPDMIGGISVETGNEQHPDDQLHSGVLEVSSDGQKWKTVADFKNGHAETGMIGFRVKAIRIRVLKDNGNWLLIREITLK